MRRRSPTRCARRRPDAQARREGGRTPARRRSVEPACGAFGAPRFRQTQRFAIPISNAYRLPHAPDEKTSDPEIGAAAGGGFSYHRRGAAIPPHSEKRGVTPSLPGRQFLPPSPLRRRLSATRADPVTPFQPVMLLSRQFHRLSHYRHEEPLTFAVP
ncbi:hypothetical protein BCEP4_120053 [Burkholderia cepacia]|nr:hypothetical protein BCEP4_120053 [Burkholderia cepacia]